MSPVRLHAPDLHASTLRPMLDAVVHALGKSGARELLSKLGSRPELLDGRHAWVSLALFEALAEEISTRLGEHWIERAAELAIDRGYRSIRGRLLRFVGSPLAAYQAFVLEANLRNRIVELKAEPLGPGAVRLRAVPRPGAAREQTPAACRMRAAEARFLPALLDLGSAEVRHPHCLLHGAQACVYEVSWLSGATRADRHASVEAAPHGWLSTAGAPSDESPLAVVVEPASDRAASLADVLRARFRVDVVTTAREALARACSTSVAVVVAAPVLPDMTADRLGAIVRESPRARGVAVVVRGEHEREVDLVERVELHASLRRLGQDLALSERRAMLGVTAASVAHQLRNPLTTLLAGLPAMRARMVGRVDAQTLELVDIMIDCAERIERMSRDLMDLSRVDREPSGVFRPSDGLRSAVRLAKARVYGGVTIDDRVEDGASIEGRAGDINHVFLNLLDNAIRAVGESGKIEITAGQENGHFVTRIGDSGRGVDPDAAERIFEPFFTTRPTGEGTGLGLAIAREIVRQHGGDIAVNRSELGGALFVVQLPTNPPLASCASH